MGIYIKDMEMPGHCGYCRFRYDGICHVLQKTQYSREKDCPLISAPPHGRLIDADALFKEMERKGWCDNADRDIAENLVLDAPTIIPPEK